MSARNRIPSDSAYSPTQNASRISAFSSRIRVYNGKMINPGGALRHVADLIFFDMMRELTSETNLESDPGHMVSCLDILERIVESRP